METKLFLRPPPQFIFDFGPDEVALLKALGDGTTIANLIRNESFTASQVARMVFALLEQRVITLSLGEAAPAWKWKAALADFETQRGERRPAPPPAPRTPPPPSARPPQATAPAAPVPAPAPAAEAARPLRRRIPPGGPVARGPGVLRPRRLRRVDGRDLDRHRAPAPGPAALAA